MRDWWRKVVRDYFTFSTGERNGVIVLCIAIALAAFAPPVITHFNKGEPEDFTRFKSEIDSFQKSVEANAAPTDSSDLKPSIADLDETKKEENSLSLNKQLFSFDPNTATADDFKNLGLKDKLVKTILNYRNKGGKFFAKEDFKKMYGLKEEEYNRLQPYIQITAHKKNSVADITKTYSTAANTNSKSALLDLNKADSLQLVALPGIGPTLSSRIIKFRNKLGGFYSVDQLKDVYGFSPENFDLAKEKIIVDPADVKKIKINEVSIDELKAHPYFKSIVTPLINYRNQHGNFKSLEDLKNIDVVTEELYKKLIPYLEI